MKEDFIDFYRKKTDRELYYIYSGKITESYGNKQLAERILGERGFDFNNIEKYQGKFELEKLLNDIEEENRNWLFSFLFTPTGSFIFGFLMLIGSGTITTSLLKEIVGSGFASVFDLVLYIFFTIVFIAFSIGFFRYSIKRKKIITARKVRIDELTREILNRK